MFISTFKNGHYFCNFHVFGTIRSDMDWLIICESVSLIWFIDFFTNLVDMSSCPLLFFDFNLDVMTETS